MLRSEVARAAGQESPLAERPRAEVAPQVETPTAAPVFVLDIAREALRAAESGVPRFSHRRSPRTYTQHQLFALLAIRRFLGWDFRAVASLAERSPSLRAAIGLGRAPHYSTLCYAERRLLKDGPAASLLDEVVALARLRTARPTASGAAGAD